MIAGIIVTLIPTFFGHPSGGDDANATTQIMWSGVQVRIYSCCVSGGKHVCVYSSSSGKSYLGAQSTDCEGDGRQNDESERNIPSTMRSTDSMESWRRWPVEAGGIGSVATRFSRIRCQGADISNALPFLVSNRQVHSRIQRRSNALMHKM